MRPMQLVGTIMLVLLLGQILPGGGKTFPWRGWRFTLTMATEQSTKAEIETMRLLKSFILQYNLDPWIKTRQICIQQGARSMSNPLTLHTSYNDRPMMLLATFLHEQMHKLESLFEADFKGAMREVQAWCPPECLDPSVCGNLKAAYGHFIVIFFEIDALKRLLGLPQTLDIIRQKEHNQWIYQKVQDNTDHLRSIYRRYHLPSRVF
jgi:hypothetical protein